jgi:hypothetical protein
VDLSFNQQRAVASLIGLFGIVARLLGAIGFHPPRGIHFAMKAPRTEKERKELGCEFIVSC